MTEENTQPGFLSTVSAEMLGTFVVVSVIVGATVIAGPVVGSLGIALATGFAVAAVYATVAHVSGGHLNPAVTIGVWLRGKCPTGDVVPYLVAQSAAAKCDRCWHHVEDVGTIAGHEEICGRCVTNVEGDGETRQFA